MKNIYFVFILFCLLVSIEGQTADDFWHPAANFYANAKFQQAMGEVENGLNLYPNDAKLNALAEKIKEQQEQQQQQQQNQEEQQSQGEEQESKDQQDQQPEQQQEEQEQQLSQAEEQDQEQMSKEDAERIMDALKNDEQENQKLRKPIKGGRRTTDKDW
jgi:alpha-galactosidase/6-phospho-beta-glucosidase family protein